MQKTTQTWCISRPCSFIQVQTTHISLLLPKHDAFQSLVHLCKYKLHTSVYYGVQTCMPESFHFLTTSWLLALSLSASDSEYINRLGALTGPRCICSEASLWCTVTVSSNAFKNHLEITNRVEIHRKCKSGFNTMKNKSGMVPSWPHVIHATLILIYLVRKPVSQQVFTNAIHKMHLCKVTFMNEVFYSCRMKYIHTEESWRVGQFYIWVVRNCNIGYSSPWHLIQT